jgi:uncharacterized protein involved in type VI secretion and phage assembly
VIDRFVGKYLGVVADNDDPRGLSRLRVRVPEVFGEETTGWCLPSSPYAGPGVGLAAVPPIGSLVFVEWPSGDTTRVPVWSGGSWTDGDGVPGAGPDAVLLVTPAGHRIALSDASGSEAVEIEAASGAKVLLDGDGVTVEFGTQKLAITRASISVNDGALEVR